VLSFEQTTAILHSWCGKRVRCVSRTHPEESDVVGVIFEDEGLVGEDGTLNVRFVVPIEPPTGQGTGRAFEFDRAGLAAAEWLEEGRMLGLSLDSDWIPSGHRDLVLTLVGPGWMP
jgi:hypothetical protein